jgi:hypothetical protein
MPANAFHLSRQFLSPNRPDRKARSDPLTKRQCPETGCRPHEHALTPDMTGLFWPKYHAGLGPALPPLNLGQVDLSDLGGSGRIEDGSEAVFG